MERQRRDLASPPPGYVFDAQEADRACRFAELLPYVQPDALRGQKFVLQPWQVWTLRTLFGWVDPVTGHARFRTASLWMCKGQGKSPLAAIIALYVTATSKGSAASYSAATTTRQARQVWATARDMLRLDPEIARRFKLRAEEHTIRGEGDSRSYAPVSSEADSIEGIVPTGVVIVDEVHAHPNRALYDNLRSACDKVEGSRLITISTAGFDLSPDAIGWQLWQRARDILVGKFEDPTTFALIIEADRKRPDGSDADPFSEETLRQANPNLGVSVSLVGLRSSAQAAKEMPSSRASFEVKHLGWWQQTAKAFIDLHKWNALADREMRREDFKGEAAFIGVDLAATRDITAAVTVIPRVREDGKREFVMFARAYLPEQSITLQKIPEMRTWARDGWLTLTPGEVMDYAVLVQELVADAKSFSGVEVCYDPWSAQPIANELAAEGLQAVEVRQGARSQSQPMKDLEAAILDGRVRHDGSPVFAYCMANLVARGDRNGNIAPDRESEHVKVDLAVAAINAMARATVADSSTTVSVYASRGLIAI